ncbi:MAG: hypothetical protein A4E57_01370 [Syntrophorhabdaceae bacterium PtaU1.Bin034]|nr:MAG: hypothetical protein A4E57_01370 [Syntrophorhabdaceae bacterium PtaU1.Bin034]
MDQCRLDYLVGELKGVTLFLLYRAFQARGTADMVGGEVLGAIHHAEVVLPQYPILFKVFPPLE